MSFIIATDSSADLPFSFLKDNDIAVISMHYTLDGEEFSCPYSIEEFNSKEFFDKLRKKADARTSMINPQAFTEFFTPYLEDGNDIMFIGMSSGISGLLQAGRIAKDELDEKYPDRKIVIIDSIAASLGEGLLVMKAVKLRQDGKDIDTVEEEILAHRDNICQFFTVGNLMHLKRTGRVTLLNAVIGTALHVKPILKGDENGRIVVFNKSMGRKKALMELAELYRKNEVNSENRTVCISHCDAQEDAQYLAELICDIKKPKELIINGYNPATGIHVGPDTVALFFEGKPTKK